MLMVTGDVAAAAEFYRAAIALTSSVQASGPDGIRARRQLRSLHLSLGQSILRSGSLSECVANYERAFEINETLLREDPDRSDPIRAKFITLNYLGYVRILMGDEERALAELKESLALARELEDAAPNDLRAQRSVVSAYLFLGFALREAGRNEDAIVNLTESLTRQRRIFQLDPANLGERNGLADCYLEIGAAEASRGRRSEAVQYLQTAIEHYAFISNNDPNDLAVKRQIVLARRWIAEAELSGGRNEAALSELRQAKASAEELVQRDPKNLEWKFELAMAELSTAKILRARGDQASVEFRNSSLKLLEGLAAISPENTHFTRRLAEARSL